MARKVLTLLGKADGLFSNQYVKMVNRYPTDDPDVIIILCEDGQVQATSIQEFEETDTEVTFELEGGFTYGSVVEDENSRAVGIICGWDNTNVKVLSPKDPHHNNWATREYPHQSFTRLDHSVNREVAKIAGVPIFAPPISINAVTTLGQFQSRAHRQLVSYERRMGEQFKFNPPINRREIEREAKFLLYATVVRYSDRVVEGQGRDSQTFWMVVPAVEAYRATTAVLKEEYGEVDLTLLRRINSRQEAYRLAHSIRRKAQELQVVVENPRPTIHGISGWEFVGDCVSFYRGCEGITIEHLALLTGLPFELVALVDAAVIRYMTQQELTSLARALDVEYFALMRNRG